METMECLGYNDDLFQKVGCPPGSTRSTRACGLEFREGSLVRAYYRQREREWESGQTCASPRGIAVSPNSTNVPRAAAASLCARLQTFKTTFTKLIISLKNNVETVEISFLNIVNSLFMPQIVHMQRSYITLRSITWKGWGDRGRRPKCPLRTGYTEELNKIKTR